MDTQAVLNGLIEKKDLDRGEAEALMGSIMSGELSAVRAAAILTALRMKGETIDEITGFVSAMREKVIPVSPQREGLIDTCGTGGDSRHTFNISTATAFVAAGMGIGVAKHGNRAVSSRCGSTDVLDALEVNLDLGPDAVAVLIDRVGLGFLFAPHHHPAMKHIAPVRRELGTRTVFNLLGPMTNPAGVKRQLIGVFRRDLTEVVARVLQALGSEKVFVVHGLDGTDEVSLSGETAVSLLEDGSVKTMTFVPEDAGVERADISALGGGDAGENAAHLVEVLRGTKGPRRDAVVLNAAFAAVVADKAPNLAEGAGLARDTIDSGAALDRLEALRRESHALANGGPTRGSSG
ncbi:MAG: anthranilate phosphoribosyltransferase [Candidatus Krumholzibacteriia bacterium]